MQRPETERGESKAHPSLSPVRAIIQEFSLNTSTHGIPGIARSSSIVNRLYWILSTLAFTAIMIYFITEAIRAYFEYPTLTLVTIKETTLQPFLAVSLCNYSPLRYDRFIGPFLNYTNQLNITNTTDTSRFTEEQSLYIRDFFQFQINRNETLTDYFFPLESMLLSCRYNGLNCSSRDFISFVSSSYGYCYTFNAQAKTIRNGTLYAQTENGGLGKLELELFIHSHQYVPYMKNGAGVVVGIHQNREMPLLDFIGQYFTPGRKHRIGFARKEHHRLSEAYQNCHVPTPYMLQAAFDHFGSAEYDYTEYSCYIVCTQVFIYSKCGCIDPYEWSARAIVLPGSKTVIHALLCNISDDCVLRAKQEFTASDTLWMEFCSECQSECSTVQYMTTVSSLLAPSKWFLPKIRAQVESSSIPVPSNWSDTWQTEIANNYIALEIAVETGRIENYTETASMSGVDVLSNVGGQTGLWIGISFLSLMEFVEMLCRLFRHGYHTITARLRPQIRT